MTAPEEKPWDLVVIGGGAAGFFGAITAAEQLGADARILILEKSSQLLGKVRISGGGRCNVTHACFDPRTFARHFPRGEKELIGPLHRWDAQKTIDWFQDRGVPLKTEADGRIFPITDDSQTIIDCLMNAASELNVKIRTRTSVTKIEPKNSDYGRFLLTCADEGIISAQNLLMATGGTRSTESSALINFTGHSLQPAVPSLFTFNIPKGGMKDLAGLSVKNAEVSIPEFNLNSQGPILITHWGLSGPAVLKLSAWGARDLHSANYTFTTTVNWLPGIMLQERFTELRNKEGKRSIATRSPFPEIHRRLRERLVSRTEISSTTSWSQLSRNQTEQLAKMLSQCQFQVQGKSMNKEEFVTCGGVNLDEVNLRTMESKRIPNLYFAGEVLNVDGITGGFNFQNAWTTGYLAGSAIS